MTAAAPARLPAAVAIAGAVAVGMLTALQARINGQLGLHLGDGFVAAVVSFGSGLVALVALSAAVPSGRRGARALASGIRHRTIPWWMLAGGAAGALTVVEKRLHKVRGHRVINVLIEALKTMKLDVMKEVG